VQLPNRSTECAANISANGPIVSTNGSPFFTTVRKAQFEAFRAANIKADFSAEQPNRSTICTAVIAAYKLSFPSANIPTNKPDWAAVLATYRHA
jgi:hypothetical protein